MKKFVLILVLFFGFSANAFAGMTFNPVSPQIGGTTVTVSCSLGNRVSAYTSLGDEEFSGLCPRTFTLLFDSDPLTPIYGTFTIIECDDTTGFGECAGLSYIEEARADPGYIGETTYTFTVPPPAGLRFMGVATGATFKNDLSAVVMGSVGSMWPILLVVMGIIIAFIVIVFIKDELLGKSLKEKELTHYAYDKDLKEKKERAVKDKALGLKDFKA